MDAQANGGTFSVKKLQEEVNEIDKKLAKLHSSPMTEGLSFEEIGFDYLFVDEAHIYKNLHVRPRRLGNDLIEVQP